MCFGYFDRIARKTSSWPREKNSNYKLGHSRLGVGDEIVLWRIDKKKILAHFAKETRTFFSWGGEWHNCYACFDLPVSIVPSPQNPIIPFDSRSQRMLNRCNIFLPLLVRSAAVRNHRFLVPPSARSSYTRSSIKFNAPCLLLLRTAQNEFHFATHWKFSSQFWFISSVWANHSCFFAPPDSVLVNEKITRTIRPENNLFHPFLLRRLNTWRTYQRVIIPKNNLPPLVLGEGEGPSMSVSDHIEQAIINDDNGYFGMLNTEKHFWLFNASKQKRN